jgi:hypothetical protein
MDMSIESCTLSGVGLNSMVASNAADPILSGLRTTCSARKAALASLRLVVENLNFPEHPELRGRLHGVIGLAGDLVARFDSEVCIEDVRAVGNVVAWVERELDAIEGFSDEEPVATSMARALRLITHARMDATSLAQLASALGATIKAVDPDDDNGFAETVIAQLA